MVKKYFFTVIFEKQRISFVKGSEYNLNYRRNLF